MTAYPNLFVISGLFLLGALVFLFFLKREAEKRCNPKEKSAEPSANKEDTEIAKLNINAALQEANLVWSRYTAFVVLDGFLVNAVTQDYLKAPSMVFVLIGLFGMILNAAWHILNCSGWKNQYLFLHYAARSSAPGRLGMPFDAFYSISMLNKFGWIYKVAQIVPQLFFLLAMASASKGLYDLFNVEDNVVRIAGHQIPYMLDVSLPVVVFGLSCILVAYSIERYILYPMGLENTGRDIV